MRLNIKEAAKELIPLRGIDGFVEAYLTNAKSETKKVYERHNTFYIDFEEALAANLGNAYVAADNIALDNQFSTSAPIDGEDGIVAILGGTTWVSFVGTNSQPAANQFRVTGVYTNATGGTVSIATPGLGKGWIGGIGPTVVPPFNDFRIALDPLFSAQNVPNTETLTIVWTITFTVH